MMKPKALATSVVLVASVAGAVAWACGPWFPNQMLDDRAATLKSVPRNTFVFEASQLLPASDKMVAVEGGAPATAPTGSSGAADARGYAAGAEAWSRATAACPAAAEDAYGDTQARPPCTTFDDAALAEAEAAFAAVLALPADPSIRFGARAAYMLGEVQSLRAARLAGTPAFTAARDVAARAFQETRARVLAGATDDEGLAVASFGEEARLYLYAGAEACLWGSLLRDDACVADLAPADMKHAVALYAAQAGHGSGSAVQSLAALAGAALAHPELATALVAGPVSQRLLVAYALARVTPQARDGQPQPLLVNLFDAIHALGTDKVASADRLAALAYELGRYDDATALLAHAQGPLADWIRAKLALRRGDANEAARAYAAAAAGFPRVDDPNASLEPANVQRVMGERGVLALSRGDYVEAMARLYEVASRVGGDGNVDDEWTGSGTGYGNDLVYIGERVLTVDELKTFVDAHAPMGSPAPPGDGKTDATGSLPLDDRLRWMLARRLMRAGRFDDALAYFPGGIDPRYGTVDLRATAHAYADALHDGDHRWTAIGKAEASYTAARIAREQGMAILGFEQGPDYNDNGGNYQGGSGQSAKSLEGEYVTAGERERFAASTAQPDRRFHYRYIAADEAAAAADLLPVRSQAFAATLCVAAGWMKEGPPDYDEEPAYGNTNPPPSERRRREAAYYARYVKQGPYVPWATDFGSACEQPDFAAARTLKRHEQARAVKQFIRRHAWVIGGVALVVLGGLLLWRVSRGRKTRKAA